MRAISIGALFCVGVLSAGASLFFCYYALRLLYLSLAGMIDEAHRTAGLHIGAAVFPIASFSFGWLGLACVKAAARRRHSG